MPRSPSQARSAPQSAAGTPGLARCPSERPCVAWARPSFINPLVPAFGVIVNPGLTCCVDAQGIYIYIYTSVVYQLYHHMHSQIHLCVLLLCDDIGT